MSGSVALERRKDLALVLASVAVVNLELRSDASSEKPAPRSQPRLRLEVEIRRAHLLELGRELFTSRRYEDLRIREIARAAGVSEGLLYHYFPSKRAFYVETLRHVAAQLLRRAPPPRKLARLEHLRASIDAYLDYIERHKTLFAAATSRALADPEVFRIIEAARLEFFERLFGELVDAPIARNVFWGWLGFTEASVRDWMDSPHFTRRELSDLFVAMFQEVVAQPSQPFRSASSTSRLDR